MLLLLNVGRLPVRAVPNLGMTAPSKVQLVAAYSVWRGCSSTCMAVVLLPWLAQQSGTQWAMTCAIATSISPALVAPGKRICFDSTSAPRVLETLCDSALYKVTLSLLIEVIVKILKIPMDKFMDPRVAAVSLNVPVV